MHEYEREMKSEVQIEPHIWNYVQNSFRTVCGSFKVPQFMRTKSCETGTTVYRSYPEKSIIKFRFSVHLLNFGLLIPSTGREALRGFKKTFLHLDNTYKKRSCMAIGSLRHGQHGFVYMNSEKRLENPYPECFSSVNNCDDRSYLHLANHHI